MRAKTRRSSGKRKARGNNMADESGVLGASGMLRPSANKEDEQKAPVSEKTTEEIDVEGTSDEEVEDSRSTTSPTADKLAQTPKESSPKEGGDRRNSGADSTEKHSESPLPPKQELEKQASSPAGKSLESAPVEKLDSGIPEQNQGTSVGNNKLEKDQVSQSEKKDTSEEHTSGPSYKETLEGSGDEKIAEARISGSGVVVIPKSDSRKEISAQMAPTDAQSAEKTLEVEVKGLAKPQKLKTFEDAFKASIGKLNVEAPRPRKVIKPFGNFIKQVGGAAPGPSSETFHLRQRDNEKVINVTEKQKGQSSSSGTEKSSGSQQISNQYLTKSPKIDATDNQKFDADMFEDERDNSRDIDNFSSDSSSTIIDIELTAKESTEEEISGKPSRPKVASQPTVESQSQESKPVVAEKEKSASKARTRESTSKPNPTSDTSSGDGTSEEQKSPSTKQPSNENANTGTKHSKEEGDTKSSGLERAKVSDLTRHKGNGDHDRKLEKRRELLRAKHAADQPRMKPETKGDGKAKLRERSKSEESPTSQAKKYRVSKHGIVLQPGMKLEAMDYSKKWYLARIVNVDETDNTVLIHFAGWNSRFDEWLEFDSDRLRPLARVSARRETAKEVKALGGYRVGDEVLARWSDCRYYPAKILGIKTNGSYRVLFYDGIEKTVMGINVRDMPESLKSQQLFSNLEHQFRALVNKKRRSSRDAEESLSGSRPSSPIQQPQKRRHPSTNQSPALKPAKRSRQDSSRSQKAQKGSVKTPEPVPPAPVTRDQPELLPSPTSAEASELMSALEHGMMGGKKCYREPLIFDKNTGLIRDPSRLVAPKELVIDLDHNKYKCEVPDCGKAFRKASLLEYHQKYYHISKPATSTSAMAAAKNAVTRSRKRLSTSASTPGSSKMRRTESADGPSAKITSRQHRISAPGILTTSHKHPLPSPKLDSLTPTPPHPLKSMSTNQFVKRQAVPDTRKPLPASRVERPPLTKPDLASPTVQQPQAAAKPKAQGSEITAKVAERSRKVSGSTASKESKPTTNKSEVVTTTVSEKLQPSPKAAALTLETKTKAELSDAAPTQQPETKSQQAPVALDSKADSKAVVKGPEVTAEIAAAPHQAPKKQRRNKPHKKHKRHKARSRDRRSREQSRSERRRAAERAKQRRLEQRQLKQSLEEAASRQKPEDVMEWTAKYLSATTDRNLLHSPAQSSDDPMLKPEGLDSSTTEDGGPRDMISCVCRNQEEEGFMIQCETCYGWQHGSCVGLTESTIPKQYICSFCIYPENLRTHARHRYDQDWFRTGQLSSLTQPQQPAEESGHLTEAMLKTHQLMADMISVTEALDVLQHKLEILKSDNHPDLKLWSYHWGLRDESTPLDDSAHTQQLQTSLEESDVLQTSAETSALTESMRSDVVVDSIMEEVIPEVVGTGTDDVSKESSGAAAGNQGDIGDSGDMGLLQEGVKHAEEFDFPSVVGKTLIPNKNPVPEETVGCLDSVNAEASPVEVDSKELLESSTFSTPTTTSDSKQDNMSSGSAPSVPDKGTPLSSTLQAETLPTEKLTACIIPDPEQSTSQGAKDGVTIESGKPVTPVHDGKSDRAERDNLQNPKGNSSGDAHTMLGSGTSSQASEVKDPVTSETQKVGTPEHDGKADSSTKEQPANHGDSSDDEPLIKYTKKSASSSEAENDTTSVAAKSTTPPPQPSSEPAPVQADPVPSGNPTVPPSICKLHLFNHIVCVEEELKRRMDYVEEQIEALELAFNQSAESKDSQYNPPDPLQMKRTISVLMDDLERVNKLVSI
ncbi:uncharacterized protein LOC110979526 isoform X2 [Acanthaster planci]|uniref:Uncharacterized protein LOC110979526 isoform X2 n=1 Tax=Acanthaster planci TaxID=133434 RepID=A0A8B7YFA9_ACAPL|nr:uncharacterized protein LOC110979526 isoform X2 [Acanthaster planci]